MWRAIMKRLRRRRRYGQIWTPQAVWCFETLEARMVLSAAGLEADFFATAADPPDLAMVSKAIVAGDPNGSPFDSPANRVDPNTTASPFGGVGSLFMDLGGGSGFLCTGTLISPTHVLTAGHCLDADDNGSPDFVPSNVSFFLNYGSNFSDILTASALHIHPDFTGFANPSVLDDVAVIQLSSSAPAGVPIYGLSTAPFVNIETTTLVGYGTTGDGVDGYIPNSATFTVKRTGMNRADVFLSDDEGSGAREGFEWDFDGSHKSKNVFGSPNGSNLTLGNAIETTVGGGDSGGPSFISDGSGGLLVFGVNTFTSFGKAPAPLFGSVGGGIVVSAYAGWISSIIGGVNQPPIANAGVDQSVATGTLVQLNGSGSSDPENDPLTYSWSLSVPAGSVAVLSDTTAVNPTFNTDVDGSYVATLVVYDGQNNSGPDSATITAGSASSSMHVGDIDGSSQVKGKSNKWSANVTVSIHNNNENPVAGATVTGQWSGATSGTVSGVTGANGSVTFSTGNLTSGTSVTFDVSNVTDTLNYNAAANHDPDGDSNGTTITVQKGSAARVATQIRAPQASSPQSTDSASIVVWFATPAHEQSTLRDAAVGRTDRDSEKTESIEHVIDVVYRETAYEKSSRTSAVDYVLARDGFTEHEELLEDLVLGFPTNPFVNALLDELG